VVFLPGAMSSMPVTAPGLCDLQVNGFAGVDFNDPAISTEHVASAAAAMEATGVTCFLPTLISGSLARFTACARTINAAAAAAIAGFHMEGPYIAAGDGPRGAHDPSAVKPASVEDFRRRQDAADGRIRLVTLAPEVGGALELIEYLAAQNVRVAIGHSAADAAAIEEAVKRGATLSTHLGNGCASTLRRHPNLIWEQLAHDGLWASFIADGHHLSPSTLKVMVRAKTPARSVLVTDATAAAGAPPGDYTLGNQRVRLAETGRVTLTSEDRLAGSALTLDAAVGNVVRAARIAPSEALAMASTQPAGYLGITPRGTIDVEWDQEFSRLTVLRVHV
jgi:N-acetylglucosamine-6-phosphate deacetylase